MRELPTIIMLKENLKSLLFYLSKKWQLSNIRPLVKLPPVNNYVALAYSAHYKTDVVLKILIADTHEPEALELFKDSSSCVKLLDYDREYRGLLLEYLQPGISLKTLFPTHDAQAIEITANVIKKLHSKNIISQAKGFKTVNQWLELLNYFQSKKISQCLLEKAHLLAQKLLLKKQELYLLHGDLHHENILQSGQEWVAIDPQGVIGPLEYEVGRFIMNPIPDLLEQANTQEIIMTRIERFSEIFGFDKQRLIDWAFVQAVLSACWIEQDGNKDFFNYFVKFAKAIKHFLDQTTEKAGIVLKN